MKHPYCCSTLTTANASRGLRSPPSRPTSIITLCIMFAMRSYLLARRLGRLVDTKSMKFYRRSHFLTEFSTRGHGTTAISKQRAPSSSSLPPCIFVAVAFDFDVSDACDLWQWWTRVDSNGGGENDDSSCRCRIQEQKLEEWWDGPTMIQKGQTMVSKGLSPQFCLAIARCLHALICAVLAV